MMLHFVINYIYIYEFIQKHPNEIEYYKMNIFKFEIKTKYINFLFSENVKHIKQI